VRAIVDLTLTSEQAMLVESVRAFLARRWALATVRTLEAEGRGFDRDVWREMARLGWLGLETPAVAGGSAQSFVETVLVCEEMGRALLPSPFVATVAIAMPLLGGNAARHWLPRVASGDALATLALAEPGWRGPWEHPALRLNGSRLTGRKAFVPFAADADLLLVAVAGPSVVAVERGAPGVACTRQATFGGDPSYDMVFDGAIAEPLGPGGDVLPQALDRGATATLAYLAGACERVLAMTIDYAKTRRQFGRPIGSFQAVAHRCVDMRSDIDALRVLVRRAAWSLTSGRRDDVEVGSAVAYGLEAVRRVFLHAHQVHGAIGFSMEHDLQLFTRRAKAAELQWGPPAWHHERVARGMGLA
jgi:alkylation response protein AidB-like acyl-CoA dehydrogenase